jgi:hypothetical protein
MKHFYVYAYLREELSPYYIGKGEGRRIDKPHRIALPPEDRRVIIKEGMTESEAFALEKLLILMFGRKDLGTGILRNLTDGGEGQSGLVHTDETKDKISVSATKMWKREELKEAARNRMIGNQITLGRKATPEEVEANRKRGLENNAFKGKHHTDETKDRIRQCRNMAVEVNGIVYPSRTIAGQSLGVTRTTICNWVKAGKASDVQSSNP